MKKITSVVLGCSLLVCSNVSLGSNEGRDTYYGGRPYNDNWVGGPYNMPPPQAYNNWNRGRGGPGGPGGRGFSPMSWNSGNSPMNWNSHNSPWSFDKIPWGSDVPFWDAGSDIWRDWDSSKWGGNGMPWSKSKSRKKSRNTIKRVYNRPQVPSKPITQNDFDGPSSWYETAPKQAR